MVDITMCVNEECPMRDKCYRATAQAGEMQSYSMFEFVEIGKFVYCDHYRECDNRTQVITQHRKVIYE